MKVANADRMGDANSIGTSRSGARSELTDMRCRNMEANSTKPASQGGGRGGAGPGGDGGGGGGGERSLQSVQSVPSLQSLNSEPGPPSSQEPSFAHIPQSSVQVEPRGAGGTGGGGGGDPRTSFSGGSTAVSGGGGDDDRGVGFICGAGNGGCAMRGHGGDTLIGGGGLGDGTTGIGGEWDEVGRAVGSSGSADEAAADSCGGDSVAGWEGEVVETGDGDVEEGNASVRGCCTGGGDVAAETWRGGNACFLVAWHSEHWRHLHRSQFSSRL